jgi:tetratricopeptide (TPR) repeat protein
LLEKICWFQVLCEDLTDLGATRQLDATGPLAKVPDWGRALLSRDVFSVENGNRFAQSTLDLEMQEADEVNQAEQQPPLADQKALAQALNTPTDDTITIDPDGHATVRVIGPGTFLAASQRHLLNAIQQCDYWMRDLLGDADQAAQFETQMTSTFGSLPHFVIASYRFPRPPGSAREEVDVTLRERSASWFVTDLPPDPFLEYFFSDPADFRVLNDFYNAGEPAGTVYDLPRRRDMIGHLHIDPRWHVSNYSPPGSKASLLKRAYFQQLQELDPDSCPLAEAVIEADQSVANGETPTQKMAILNRFMDYCVAPYHLLLSPPDNPDLGNADLETIYKKEAPLVPDVYFRLGTLLRKEGRDDDAAEADRKGAARAFDDVLVANSVGPLIDYDLAHGKPDEALAMAKRAAQVYSEQGMLTYVKVLEKLNHLDEAESWAKNLNDQYADNQGLLALYVAHPEHFPKQADDLKKKTLPQGQAKVSINSFSGPPATGAVFTSASQLLTDSGLEQGDVVVAFNSIKVESMSQYDYIRAQMSGTDMDLIVWHDNEYREIHASPPDHMFGVGMSDYPVH